MCGRGVESCDRKKAGSYTEPIIQYSLLVAYRKFEEFKPIRGMNVKPRTVLYRKNTNTKKHSSRNTFKLPYKKVFCMGVIS